MTIDRLDKHYRLTARQWFPKPRDEVFAFFADANNLGTITPPHLHFTITSTHPLEMREGLLIDYRIRLRGIPIRWRTEITMWTPNVRFMDRQLRGPYQQWEHEHRFLDRDGGTLMIDVVDYRMLFGFVVHPLLVKHDLRGIFQYRYDTMADRFGGRGRESDFPETDDEVLPEPEATAAAASP